MSLEDRATKAYQDRQREYKATEERAKLQRKRMAEDELNEKWCPRMGIKEKLSVGDVEKVPGSGMHQRITSGYPFEVEGHKFYADFHNGLVVYLDGYFDRVVDSLDTLGELLEQKRHREQQSAD